MGGLQSLPTLPAHLPLDWVIIAVLALLFAIDAFRSGAERACVFALALPIAYMLQQFIFHAAVVSSSVAAISSPLSQALLFLGLLVFAAAVIMRIGLDLGAEAGRPIQATLAGVGVTTVALVFWFLLPQLASIWSFGPQVQSIFAEQYRFWLLAAGYVALAVARS